MKYGGDTYVGSLEEVYFKISSPVLNLTVLEECTNKTEDSMSDGLITEKPTEEELSFSLTVPSTRESFTKTLHMEIMASINPMT